MSNVSRPTPPRRLIIDRSNWTPIKEEEEDIYVPIICTKGGVKAPFPVKLMDLLNLIDAEENALACIISWQPSGRSFMVKDKDRFEKDVQRHHFDQTNYTSFRRQLNLWGFKRIDDKCSLDYGAYFHPMFYRDDKFSCRLMRRPTKATTKRVSTKMKSVPLKKKIVSSPPFQNTLAIRTGFNITSAHWSFDVPKTPDQVDEFEPIVDESQIVLPQETVSLFLGHALQNNDE